MNVIDYLNQIKCLDELITNKQEELEQLFVLATKTGIGEQNPDRVQTQSVPDKMAVIACRRVDLQNEVQALVEYFLDVKYQIIGQIEELQEVNFQYYNLLHKKYVQYKKLYVIASEMNYSYQRIKELHKEALEEFANIIPNHTE